MIKGIATLIMLFVPLPIAYRYGRLASRKEAEVKSLIEAGSYPKGLLDEN